VVGDATFNQSEDSVQYVIKMASEAEKSCNITYKNDENDVKEVKDLKSKSGRRTIRPSGTNEDSKFENPL
jgi:flagellar hook assembly protein FlgD